MLPEPEHKADKAALNTAEQKLFAELATRVRSGEKIDDLLKPGVVQIPQDQLLENRWYAGRGRNANVALWAHIGDRHTFLTIGFKFGQPVVKDEGYWRDEHAPGCGALGCFQPFALVDEGVVLESVGSQPGWDTHYALRMAFNMPLIETLLKLEETVEDQARCIAKLQGHIAELDARMP